MQSEYESGLAVSVDYGVALRGASALDSEIREFRKYRRDLIELGSLELSARWYRHLCEAKAAARHLREAKAVVVSCEEVGNV